MHEQPRPDGYGQVRIVGVDGVLESDHIGVPHIRVADLLAAAGV